VPPIGGHAPREKTAQGGLAFKKSWLLKAKHILFHTIILICSMQRRPEHKEKGWGKNGKGEGEWPDGKGVIVSVESPLVCSAFYLRFIFMYR